MADIPLVYLRLTTRSPWHILNSPVSRFVRAKCGQEYELEMCQQKDALAAADPVCKLCLHATGGRHYRNR